MPTEPGKSAQRVDITYFDGLNSSVQRMLAKRQEFSHVENARAGTIGSIEKRQGQAKYGTARGGWPFIASENYGLFKFFNEGPNIGVFRVSTSIEPNNVLTISVFDSVYVIDKFNPTSSTLFIKTSDYVTVSEPTFFRRLDSGVVILDGTSQETSIWSLDPSLVWQPLQTGFIIDGASGPSPVAAAPSNLSISCNESVWVLDTFNPSNIFLRVYDSVRVSEAFNKSTLAINVFDSVTVSEAQPFRIAYHGDNHIIGGIFDTVTINGNKQILANRLDYNREINSDGITVTDSTQAGDLFNSPRASKVTFYKNRIYLADFMRAGVRYKTTIVRSSYPLGLIALVNGDYNNGGGTGNWIIPTTDNKYFYADTGMNIYEIYRGANKVATITISSVDSTTVTATNNNVVFQSGYTSFLSADEIWVQGTFNGEKQYRWTNNSSSSGQDVKQYDTFSLGGGDNDPITMMEPIGNVLLVANKNSFLTWNDYSLQNFDQGVGCVSNNGYVKILGSLYFMHYSGVYSTNGSTPTLISRKIERYIKGATKSGLENCAAGYKNLSIFFTIGDVTLYNNDGSFWKIMPDVCLEYNIADQLWFVHTNVPAKELINFISQDGVEHTLFLHTAGIKSVKEFLVGNNDDGDEIFFRVDLPPIQLMKEQEVFANPIAVAGESERGSLIRCFVSLDTQRFYELQGDLKKGISYIKVTSSNPKSTQPVTCHWIQLSFRESSKQICRLIQVSIIFLPTTVTEAE